MQSFITFVIHMLAPLLAITFLYGCEKYSSDSSFDFFIETLKIVYEDDCSNCASSSGSSATTSDTQSTEIEITQQALLFVNGTEQEYTPPQAGLIYQRNDRLLGQATNIFTIKNIPNNFILPKTASITSDTTKATIGITEDSTTNNTITGKINTSELYKELPNGRYTIRTSIDKKNVIVGLLYKGVKSNTELCTNGESAVSSAEESGAASLSSGSLSYDSCSYLPSARVRLDP